MADQFPFPTWPDVAADLINVAAGRAMADTVIKGGIWVNVQAFAMGICISRAVCSPRQNSPAL